MVWYFIGVYVINRKLHGRFEILNLSSRVVFKNISLVHCADSWNIFSILEGKFRISKHLCNILFVNNIDLSAEIGDIRRSYYLVKVLRLRWVVAYLLHFPFLGIFFQISFPLFFFNLELKTRPGECLVLPYICFGPVEGASTLLSSLLQEVFSGCTGFSLSSKTTFPNSHVICYCLQMDGDT